MLKKIMMMIVVAVMAAPLVFAQGAKPNKAHPRSRMLTYMSHPTKVTGEGLATGSGVRYWDIQAGEGTPAEKGHLVKLVYTAWLESGTEIAGSRSIDNPTTFTLGAGQVIKGWEDGVEGMKAGGKRQIRIPAELAYGAAGVPPLVPPNSKLIFDIQLLEVQ